MDKHVPLWENNHNVEKISRPIFSTTARGAIRGSLLGHLLLVFAGFSIIDTVGGTGSEVLFRRRVERGGRFIHG